MAKGIELERQESLKVGEEKKSIATRRAFFYLLHSTDLIGKWLKVNGNE